MLPAEHSLRHSTAESVLSVLTLPMTVHLGTVIDFETTGRPGIDPSHEVVALGYTRFDRAVVVGRRTADRSRFYDVLRPLLGSLPRPFLAYNASFEMAVVKEELGMDVAAQDFVDIMDPWREKADSQGMKWPRLDELVSEPEEYFGEATVTGRDVPTLWRAYVEGRDEEKLRLIMDHCLSDVMREAMLVVRYKTARAR